MKILMVSEDVPHRSMGGLARHALTLAQALAGSGHEVDFMGNNIVSFSELGKDVGFLGSVFPDLDMRRIGWKEVPFGIYNPIRRPFIAWQFAKAILRKAESYDVVHYHGHFPLLAIYIPRNINFIQTRHDQGSDCLMHVRFRDHDICRETSPLSCAACATAHPKAAQRFVSGTAVWMYRKLVAKAFRRHKTVFVSEMLRQNFCRTAGNQYWGEVVHNFADCLALEQYASDSKGSPGTIHVFIASKLYEPKGVGEFLKLLHANTPPNMRVSIAGDGIDESMLRNRFGNDHIVFLGWQDYPATIRSMSQADVVIVPSIVEESCATTVIEALALSKKTFALNRGGTPELKRYERFPGQLLLFQSMEALVSELLGVNLAPSGRPDSDANFGADISFALKKILEIYSRPCR